MDEIAKLEIDLNDFDPAVRQGALQELATLAAHGEVPLEPESDRVNMHGHTFFSFNAYGHSPASLAWLAKKHGFRVAGIVDFDVLDGVDEFLDACTALQVRGAAGIETRVFIPEYATKEINSPGEPGVCYHMGIGFTSSQVPESVSGILADLRHGAAQRNRNVAERVNAYLDPVTIDYDRDVVPLSPGGTPTERHMVVAYIQAVEGAAPDPAIFWSGKLDITPEEATRFIADPPQLQNLVRARLMKRGGVGYVQPDSGMFPSLETLHQLIEACGALPCGAWLDGTSAGEADAEEWLAFLVDRGAVALNIIPDRNWNISDPVAKRLKLGHLYRVVEAAQALDLPLNVGTEMNSFGQKLVDDFDAPELAPLRQAFLDGAYFIYGHTMLQRAAGMGFLSDWARSEFPSRPTRNQFYTEVGYLVPPGIASLGRLEQLDPTASPQQILSKLGE